MGVLIIHGYGGSIGDYRALAERLHKFGYTIYGLRLAGHGQGQLALRRSTLPEWQQSVVNGLVELHKKCNKIFMVGSSFGGVLVLDYAAQHSDVIGLVLVNTALSYSGAGIFQGLVLRLMRLFTPDYPKRGLTAEERQQAEKIGSASAWPIDGILTTSSFAKTRVAPSLTQVTVSALIMRSHDDPIVGAKNSERLMARLGSENKELVTIPVATHRPFRNEQANDFMAEKIQKFIERVVAL